MSIVIMTKRCIHCYRNFTYNPSTGDFGKFCKHCGKPQTEVIDGNKRTKNPKTGHRFPKSDIF